jgi:hypothetical protein
MSSEEMRRDLIKKEQEDKQLKDTVKAVVARVNKAAREIAEEAPPKIRAFKRAVSTKKRPTYKGGTLKPGMAFINTPYGPVLAGAEIKEEPLTPAGSKVAITGGIKRSGQVFVRTPPEHLQSTIKALERVKIKSPPQPKPSVLQVLGPVQRPTPIITQFPQPQYPITVEEKPKKTNPAYFLPLIGLGAIILAPLYFIFTAGRQPYSITLNVPSTVNYEIPLQVSATANNGAPPYSYEWNFGDNQTIVAGQNAIYYYHESTAQIANPSTTPVVYTVTCTATDANGKMVAGSSNVSVYQVYTPPGPGTITPPNIGPPGTVGGNVPNPTPVISGTGVTRDIVGGIESLTGQITTNPIQTITNIISSTATNPNSVQNINEAGGGIGPNITSTPTNNPPSTTTTTGSLSPAQAQKIANELGLVGRLRLF